MKIIIWDGGVINKGKDDEITCLQCILCKTCHRRMELAKVMHNIIIEFDCPDLIPDNRSKCTRGLARCINPTQTFDCASCDCIPSKKE